MKTIKFPLIFVLCSIISINSYSQHSLNNSFYITPGFNKPSDNFGYAENLSDRSLNTVGFGFGAGFIHYFGKSDTNPVNFGLDITFAELCVNVNRISLVMNNYVEERNLSTIMLAMKAGPIITIVPQGRLGLDLYSQFMLGLSGIDYYYNNNDTDYASAVPQYRFVAGARFGYNIMYFNFEYSYGKPTVKRITDTNHNIEELKINQSFLRFGITLKFKAFD